MPRSFIVWSSESRVTFTVRRAHLAREAEAIIVDVGDHDVARADMTCDRHRHDADRASARDQHVLADQVE
jgi:hypothetical protein